MDQDQLKDILDENGIDYDESGQEILTECPFCGSDKKKLSFNPDKNAMKCWVCGESGHINKGLAAHGITDFDNYIPDEEQVEAKMVKIRSYLALRGFKTSSEYPNLDKFIKAVRMDYKDSETLTSKKGNNFQYNNAIVMSFQGLSEDGYTSVGYKYRSLDSDPFLKFFHKDGPGAPKYYIPNLKRFKEAKSVVINESETDAQTLEYFGINAIATTGVQKLDYVNDLHRFDKIYFVSDNDTDPKTRKQVQIATKKALAAIRNANPNASLYIAKLPMHIKDANEALADYGWDKQAFEAMLAKAEEYLEGTMKRSSSFFLSKMSTFLQDDSTSQGLPTGFPGIDKALGGGERLGEIDALVARAKSGKNSLYHQLMWNRLASGTPIGYISRELRPESEVLPNLFSIEFGVNFWKLKSDMPDKFDYYMEKAREVDENWPLYFANGLGLMSIEEIAQFVRESKKVGVNYFYMDHFHRAMVDSEDKKEIARFIHEIKTLVSEENIHLHLIVQPTKIENGKEVNYSNMRGSVTIEQEVDQLWEFNRVPDETNITKLRLAAARHRLAKSDSTIYFKYDPETTRMVEVELEETPQDAQIDSPTADYRIDS